MDAIKFLKEKSRMCYSFSGEVISGCDNCPLFPCNVFEEKHPEQAVSIVDEWSKEHPTYTVNLGALNERQKRALRELGDAIIKIAEQSVQVIKEEFLPE